MSESRCHIAVMFTDIVGYTAIMGSDEDKAFEVLKKNREIHRQQLAKFNGTLIKEMGDGMLVSFSLASDAVRCAIEIQKACKTQKIPLKIGIHEGEMVFAGTDVLGDAVNVASRLESDTKEGCIYISGSVFRDIKNRTDIKTKFIKEKTFKNVDEPIKVYQVLCEIEPNEPSVPKINGTKKKPYYILAALVVVVFAILLVWHIIPSKPAVELEKSIAVLPFKYLSNNPDDLYLADGMMDAILNHLQKIEDLSVRSRTSTEQYRDPNRNISEIGKALKVNYILEGSFQKIGDKANLNVQLIIAETDEHIWAEDYDREWSAQQIFEVQKEVAERVSKELYASISNEARMGIETIPTTNTMAYELFLKGNQSYWQSWIDKNGKGKLEESIIFFEKAIELDNDFSLAYTGLGRSYWLLADYSNRSEEQNLYTKAKKNLKKAIELDKYNGWAYAELSVVLDNWDTDSTSARINLDMAKMLKSNDINIYIHYFFHEWRLGNCNKLKWVRERQIEIDPNWDHPLDFYNLALLYCKQDYEAIEEIFDKYWEEKIANEKEVLGIRFGVLINTFIQLKNVEKGKTVLQKYESEQNYYPKFYDAMLMASVGKTELALDLINKWENGQNSHAGLAALYASIGDKEKMYSHLNSALIDKNRFLLILNEFAVFNPYWEEESFKTIVNKAWTPRIDNTAD